MSTDGSTESIVVSVLEVQEIVMLMLARELNASLTM